MSGATEGEELRVGWGAEAVAKAGAEVAEGFKFAKADELCGFS